MGNLIVYLFTFILKIINKSHGSFLENVAYFTEDFVDWQSYLTLTDITT